MKSKVIVFTGPNRVLLDEIEVPDPGPGEVLVKTILTGVSTATEIRVLSGKQNGGTFPLVPGYENIGKVIETGKGSAHRIDELVFHPGSRFTGPFTKCWGAQQEYALVSDIDAYRIPEGLELENAIHAKVGAIALHGVKRAEVSSEDTVVIVGLGLIGHWAAQCAKARNARVIGVDTIQDRLDAAASAGIDYLVNATIENVEERVRDLSGNNVSIAMDVTGISGTIKNTAGLLRPMPWVPPYPPSPKLIILGSYKDPIVLEYDPLFMDEVDILFSRDTRPDDIRDMLNLMAQGKVRPGAISSRNFPVDDAPGAYRTLIDQKLMRMSFTW